MLRPTRRPGERGFALPIVLWSAVLLAEIVTGMTASGRGDVQLAANLRASAVAEAAADGAVYAAAFHLLDPAAPWQADGRAIAAARPGAVVTLCIVNESSKINPNKANAGLLAALFRELGMDVQNAVRLAQAIYDWRTSGPDAAAVQPYREAGLSYGPAGAPFENLAGLAAVLGMTPPILRLVSPYLSVWNDTDPDPLAASPVVNRAITDVAGASPVSVATPLPLRTVSVAAMAETAQGGRFIRRAAIRLGSGSPEPLMTVLAWDALDGSTLPACR